MGSVELVNRPDLSLHRELPENPGRATRPQQWNDVQKSCDCRWSQRQPRKRAAVELGVVVSDKVLDVDIDRQNVRVRETSRSEEQTACAAERHKYCVELTWHTSSQKYRS